MLNNILSYTLFLSGIIGLFIVIVLFSRIIIMMFNYIKLNEATRKYRNELSYVKTQTNIIKRNIKKLRQDF